MSYSTCGDAKDTASDGNWFTHFWDSLEQALFCVVLYKIVSQAGGTIMCEDRLDIS
ncbi:hypothetical protein K439DRAFT_949211 [Ramaria rubella]|nr:hypothetical protein K439DRAFT_949211 [Ramaria rubella]